MEYSLSGVNRLDTEPDLGEPWLSGQPLKFTPPMPIRFHIDKNSHGQIMRAIYNGAYPLYRDDVLETLQRAGVLNLELFDVEIINESEDKIYANYKAVNILGLIQCACTDSENDETFDISMEGLSIDEEKAGGALFFRLAENISAVVVHEKVVDAFESSNIPGIEFYDPEMWSG